MLRRRIRIKTNEPLRARTRAKIPSWQVLRKLRERYEGKLSAPGNCCRFFAESLPPSLRYEGKASLDWFLDGG